MAPPEAVAVLPSLVPVEASALKILAVSWYPRASKNCKIEASWLILRRREAKSEVWWSLLLLLLLVVGGGVEPIGERMRRSTIGEQQIEPMIDEV